MSFHDPKPTYWTKQSVDHFGSEFAKALGIKPGADLHRLVESLGGEVIYGWQSIDEVNGGSIVVRSYDDFTIYLSEMTSPKRDRFTIAHELGHLCMHYEPLVLDQGDGVIMRATREKRLGDSAHERAEWEANWFAAGFLMPREIFVEKASQLTDEQLATYFGVSAAAISVRKKSIGIQ